MNGGTNMSYAVADLNKSGLDVDDMRIRPLEQAERHATGAPLTVDGYTIPYFDMTGKPLPFYRVKLKDWDPKYKQLIDEPNHVYFPLGFWELAQKAPYIILTEGEKKAACGVFNGFAMVGLGGVDSWSNKTINLPKDTKLSKTKDGRLVAKLTAGTETSAQASTLATGMKELINLLVTTNKPLIIVYDSDNRGKVTGQVQAAAARLGYALRFQGVKAVNIRQLILEPPPGWTEESFTWDDLLARTKVPRDVVRGAIDKVLARPSAFPRHPNPRDYINGKLRNSRMSREQLQSLSMAILCDMDSKGARLHSPDEDELYYFSRESHELIKATFNLTAQFSKSPFGIYLYQAYNLSISDERILTWLGTLYSGEEPVSKVHPEKVVVMKGDALYYQISPGQMIRVNADEIRILDNGNDNVLFQSDAVEALDKGKLIKGINKLLEEETLPNYWHATIKDTRIADSEDGRIGELLSYLYSISPWFYRWRGTQLPVEMTLGEPGSGKSTLYTLRLNVLNGRPKLRNPPKDLRDWGVSVGNTGGLHVTDNVNMVNSTLRQELSDEMCRLITEPNPTIEKRKLYTDNDIVYTPVQTVFAITSIKQPFNNPDIIQRSYIVTMDKGAEAVKFDMTWADDKLALYGGREGWIAQQMVFVHRLLGLVRDKWRNDYKASFRLVNAEQLLMLAAEAYGDPEKGSWIPKQLAADASERIAGADLLLGALRVFSEAVIAKYGNWNKQKYFTAKDIAAWAEDQDEYKDVNVLTNSRSLGKYLNANPNLLATVAGLTGIGKRNNAESYVAHTPKGV